MEGPGGLANGLSTLRGRMTAYLIPPERTREPPNLTSG
jgi:hypothetical protein